MRVFYESFAKFFGFLFAILVFLLIVTIISSIFNTQNTSLFQFTKGDKNSLEEIAILNLEGPIISNPNYLNNLNTLLSIKYIYPSLINRYIKDLEERNIAGLVISIDSVGGSVAPTDEIFNLLNNYKNKNKIPIYFHTTNILASGGYWISLSGDKIYANYGALIGSIGVKGPDWLYYNTPNTLSSGLLGGSIESNKGIELFTNTAGISKDIFNPFRKPNEKEKTKLQEIVNNIYDNFVNKVSKSRKLEKSIIVNEIGAMIFDTAQAKKKFLIDDQKTLDEVIEGMSDDLKLKKIKIISNKSHNKYNFLQLNYIKNAFNKKNIKEHKIQIKNNFCNSLSNQFSSILFNFYNSDCYQIIK